MLVVDGISVSFGAIPILRGVGFEVPRGVVRGLVGRNGAGKTTTMRAIMGLVPLAAGSVILDDAAISEAPGYTRAASGIGYLPEDRRLIGSLTVRENLLLPVEMTGAGDGSEKLATVFRLLPEVEEIAKRRASALSGGQQKFAALARSFMTGDRLLLLDEPFEGISVALSKRLAEAIRIFQEMRVGCSVLIAESDMNRIAMLVREAFVIERGQIVDTIETGKALKPGVKNKARAP